MAPIHYASKYGNLQVVQWLWAFQNESLLHFTKRKWNSLHYSCWSGHVDVTEFLLKNGIDPNSKSDDKETPMMLASFLGNDDILNVLIGYGANIQGEEKKPLYWASKGGHLSTVKLLVENGANIDDFEGSNVFSNETPLMVASRYGFIDIVEYLIKKGADKLIKNSEEYKELETFPNTQIFQDLEVRQIDTGFARNDFNENYESFKDTQNDRFTREQYDIQQCLEELKNEEFYVYAVYKLYTFLRESPFQTFNCFTDDYFNLILTQTQRNETREYCLLSLCYIIQIIKNHELKSDYIKILFDFDFFALLNEIIKNSIEIMFKNYCLFLALHSFHIEEFQEALIESGILETAKSLNILDDNTNILISRLFETAFSIQNKSIIDSLSQTNCEDYLLNIAFYSEMSKSKSYGLRGLLNLLKNFPEYTSILEQNNSINLLKDNLSNRNEEIRNYSSEILAQCISNPNFPILKLYEYNIVRPMLETFEWDDSKLYISSLRNIKELVYQNNSKIIQQIVQEINKVNFFEKIGSLIFNVKADLIMLFVDLFMVIDSNQVKLIVKDNFLDFLYDIINTGENVDSIALILLNILNKSTDEQFTNAIFEFFTQKSLVSALEDVIQGKAKTEEVSHVELLIKVIKEHISNDAND